MPAAIPESSQRKSRLRVTLQQVLRDVPADSSGVCAALDRWLEKQTGLQTIAVFSALPGEVDLSEFIARHPRRCWVYPRVAGHHLAFHVVKKPALELTPGAFGIREPSPATAEIPVDRIDAFLCPGLAFDSQGGRLGRGRGFYDRMLAGARHGAVKVGVCFAKQIVPDTFSGAHDVRMDVVVSA